MSKYSHRLPQVHASEGATIMRVFSHSNFDSVPDPMMPAFGQYNESALQRLDLALVAAAQHGIRLILVLGNYWPFLGGKSSSYFLDHHPALMVWSCCEPVMLFYVIVV